MSYRQSHLATTSDGFLGGAFVVVGFVVLVVVAAVDLITSRWSPVPTFDTTQVKEDPKQTSVAPLQDADSSTDPDVKNPIEPASDVATQEIQLISPPTRDLDDKSAADVEESRAEVPLPQDQDLRLAEPTPTPATHETTVPNDSSQEWVSLSKPDAESLSSIQASDVHPEMPMASLVSPQQEDPQAGAPSSLEFSSSALVDAPSKLHESATTIRSDTSSPLPTTPEPDNHSFDDAAVRIQSDTEKKVPLNPESSPNVEFSSVGEVKARTSTPSLSSSINQTGTSEIAAKTKRGNSFLKKQRSLINKVFKVKDGSSDNGHHPTDIIAPPSNGALSSSTVDSHPLASSLISEPETMEHSITSAHHPPKKLTSPSRVSLGSIRSISGSIKKKIGRSSQSSDRDTAAAAAVLDSESHLENLESSQPSKVADANASAGPSLLKTMFKIRKPSN